MINIAIVNISSRLLDRFMSTMYITALPVIMLALHASQFMTQLSVIAYTAGLIVSYLIGSSIADYYGKRIILLLGLLVGLVGLGYVIVFASNALDLIIGRFIQALGVGCVPAIANGILSDEVKDDTAHCDDNRRAIVLLSYLSVVFTWFPAIAMLLGGAIAHHFGWISIFMFLFVLNACTLILLYFCIPRHQQIGVKNSETKGTEKKLAVHVLSNYSQLFSHRQFVSYSVILGLMISGIAGYYIVAPFIYYEYFKLTTIEIGYLSFIQIAGYLLGKLIAVPFIQRHRYHLVEYLGIASTLIGALLMLLLPEHIFSYFVLLIPITVFSMGVGLLSPYVNIKVMRYIKGFAAGAEGLFSTIIFSISAVMTFILSLFMASQIVLGVFLLILVIFIGLVYLKDLSLDA